jgi:hypothetical protein
MSAGRIRPFALATGIALAVAALVGGAVAAPAMAAPSAATAYAQILADTNALRAQNGLAPLAENPAIDAVAQNWANQLGAGATFDHNPSFFSQMPAGADAAGENIAGGFRYTTVVNSGWAKSPGHLANMLGDYTDIGIGYWESADGRTAFAVQDFGHYPAHVGQTAAPSPTPTPTATPTPTSTPTPTPTSPAPAPSPYGADGRPTYSAAVSLTWALYQDVLHRAPDSSGASYWVGALAYGGRPVSFAVNGVLASDEYYLARIDAAYQSALGRSPDAGGRAYWLSQISSGALPVDQVQMTLTKSQEFYDYRSAGDPFRFVDYLFQTLLGRSASWGDQVAWADFMSRYGRGAAIDAIYTSAESAHRRIDALYLTYFQRHADPDGLGYWTPLVISQGDQSLRGMLVNSPEYLRNAVARYPN